MLLKNSQAWNWVHAGELGRRKQRSSSYRHLYQNLTVVWTLEWNESMNDANRPTHFFSQLKPMKNLLWVIAVIGSWFPAWQTDGFLELATWARFFGQQTRPFNEWATEITCSCFKSSSKDAKVKETNAWHNKCAMSPISQAKPQWAKFLN